jgi:hypothetical protein
MFKLTYTNSEGQSVKIGAAPPIMLSKCTGIEGAKNSVSTAKAPEQDGETFTGMSLDKGERTLSGSICVSSSTEVESYRRQLITAFNTKLSGTLQFSDRGTRMMKSCDCKTEDISFGDPNGQIIDFDVTLLCPNPFWHDIAESVDEIALWLPKFEFDSVNGFEIDSEDGMEFGERAPSLIVDVQNPGDVPCGMKIIFTALGTLTNPSIFNVNTREYFKITKTMQAGETIEIDTKFGQKGVAGYLNGETLNYWNYADLPDSTFLQLQPGSNPLRYNADSGLDNLDVTIRYSPQYLGV